MIDITTLLKQIEVLAAEIESNAITPEYMAAVLRTQAALLQTAANDSDITAYHQQLETGFLGESTTSTNEVVISLPIPDSSGRPRSYKLATATLTRAGLMSAADKSKVDKMPKGQLGRWGEKSADGNINGQTYVWSHGSVDEENLESRKSVMTFGQTRIFQENGRLLFRKGIWDNQGDSYVTREIPLATSISNGIMPANYISAVDKLSNNAAGEQAGGITTESVTIVLPITTTVGGNTARTFTLNAATSARAGLMTAADKAAIDTIPQVQAGRWGGNASGINKPGYLWSDGSIDENSVDSRKTILTFAQTRIYQENGKMLFRKGIWDNQGDSYSSREIPLANTSSNGIMPAAYVRAVDKLSNNAIGEQAGGITTTSVSILLPITTTVGGSTARTFTLNAATSARAGLMTASDKAFITRNTPFEILPTIFELTESSSSDDIQNMLMGHGVGFRMLRTNILNGKPIRCFYSKDGEQTTCYFTNNTCRAMYDISNLNAGEKITLRTISPITNQISKFIITLVKFENNTETLSFSKS